MGENKFDEILDFLCSGIMSKSERQSVRDELFDHLMCKYETNLAVGMDEEKAENNALEELGDASTLRYKLGQVHSYAPKPTLKKAMNLLIFGYVLTSFHISFFIGMKEITTFIGAACVLVALYCLRTANKRLNEAFYIRAVIFVLTYSSIAVEQIYSVPFSVTAVMGIISNALSPVFGVLLLLGLYELVKPYLQENSKKIPFTACGVFNVLLGVCTEAVYIVMAMDGKTSINIESIFLLAVVFIGVVLDLVVFVRVSNLLWNSDHEYKIEDSAKKKALAAIIAVTVAIVPILSVDCYHSTQKAETEIHSIEDAELSQGEYEQICDNLLSYGIPEKIVYNLPKSEIINYSGSVNKSELSEQNQKIIDEAVSTHYYDIIGDEMTASACAIGLVDESGRGCIRIISWVEYPEKISGGYSDGVFWEYPALSMIPQNSSADYNGDFLLIISEENGEIIKNEPLDIYSDSDALTDRMVGVRFQAKAGLTVIHAETLALSDSENRISNYVVETYRRRLPVSLAYRSLYEFRNSGEHESLEYKRNQSLTLISWAIPGADYNIISEEV